MSDKLKVLLIPDFIGWALGSIAREIAKWNQDYDCTIVSLSFIQKHPDRFKDASKGFDLIHYLPPSGFDTMRELLGSYCAYVSSIHHVLGWDKVSDVGNADAVMVVSGEWGDFVVEQGVPAEKVIRVPLGVDTMRFYAMPELERLTIRKHLHIAASSFVIGSFGKQTPYLSGRKGADVLIDALKILATTQKNLSLLTLGGGWPNVFRELRGTGIKLVNVPYVPDDQMARYYNAIDCYWVTSRVEGGPLPLIESMSCHKPVITTPVGLAKDLVEDGQNAFMVDKNDPVAFAQKTLELIESPELCAKLGKNGRETILAGYQWSRYAQTVPPLYKAALANAGIAEQTSPAVRDAIFDGLKPSESDILEEYLLWIKLLRNTGDLAWADRMQFKLWKEHPFQVPLPNPLMSFISGNRFAKRLSELAEKSRNRIQRRIT